MSHKDGLGVGQAGKRIVFDHNGNDKPAKVFCNRDEEKKRSKDAPEEPSFECLKSDYAMRTVDSDEPNKGQNNLQNTNTGDLSTMQITKMDRLRQIYEGNNRTQNMTSQQVRQLALNEADYSELFEDG